MILEVEGISELSACSFVCVQKLFYTWYVHGHERACNFSSPDKADSFTGNIFTGATDETCQQSRKQGSFRHILKRQDEYSPDQWT